MSRLLRKSTTWKKKIHTCALTQKHKYTFTHTQTVGLKWLGDIEKNALQKIRFVWDITITQNKHH